MDPLWQVPYPQVADGGVRAALTKCGTQQYTLNTYEGITSMSLHAFEGSPHTLEGTC